MGILAIVIFPPQTWPCLIRGIEDHNKKRVLMETNYNKEVWRKGRGMLFERGV